MVGRELRVSAARASPRERLAAPHAPPRAPRASALVAAAGAGTPSSEIVSPRLESTHDRAADGRGERAHDLVEPALLEHEPLEPLVDRDAALEHLVLLVHEPRERLLGERDEGQLVRAPRTPGSRARAPPRRARPGSSVVVEAGAEPEPGQVVPGEQPHELALALLGVELDAGREQQLAARQPGRRIGQLRDVHPADRGVGAVLAGRKLEAHLGRRGPGRSAASAVSVGRSGPTPRSAPGAAPGRSPRTPRCPRSAEARAGSRGRRGRRRGRSARACRARPT